jgi:hypothetical protein
LARYYNKLYALRNTKRDECNIAGKPIRFQGIGLNINQCWSPRWVALSVLPDSFKQFVSQEIDAAFEDREVKLFYNQEAKIGEQLDQFKNGLNIFKFEKKHLTLWQDHITIYDKARGTDITTLHPKYKELLEYDRS